MKNYLIIIVFLITLLCSCGKEKENRKVKNIESTSDSLVTVIVDATEFGFPVKVGSEKDKVYLYEEEKAKDVDTVQLKVFPMDLLEVSYPYPYEKTLKATLCVIPNDTIIAKFTQENVQTSVLRKGEKINVKWNEEKLLPKNKDYAIIQEMYGLFEKIASPPPPPLENAPEITKKNLEKRNKDFYTRKIDFTQRDTLKKYAEKYFAGIQKYYKNRLSEVGKEPDSLKQNFYKSYILYKEYLDLQRIQKVAKKQEFYPVLKQICDEQASINGAFLESTLRSYFFDNFFFNRENKLLLTTIYDSIIPIEFQYLEKALKEITLKEMIYKKYTRKDIMTYVDKFVKQYGSNKKIEEIKAEIEYDYEITDDLNLIGTDGTKTTFEELRMKHKDKVLYVDFWASWCNPCRMMLPESKKLHKEFNNKDIVFIYLALWNKEKDWKTACKEEQLYENSFFVINSKTSTFVDKMKIGYIPYYMIYDKSGKLYQKDAPRPNTQEIRKILKDLTK